MAKIPMENNILTSQYSSIAKDAMDKIQETVKIQFQVVTVLSAFRVFIDYSLLLLFGFQTIKIVDPIGLQEIDEEDDGA